MPTISGWGTLVLGRQVMDCRSLSLHETLIRAIFSGSSIITRTGLEFRAHIQLDHALIPTDKRADETCSFFMEKTPLICAEFPNGVGNIDEVILPKQLFWAFRQLSRDLQKGVVTDWTAISPNIVKFNIFELDLETLRDRFGDIERFADYIAQQMSIWASECPLSTGVKWVTLEEITGHGIGNYKCLRDF